MQIQPEDFISQMNSAVTRGIWAGQATTTGIMAPNCYYTGRVYTESNHPRFGSCRILDEPKSD